MELCNCGSLEITLLCLSVCLSTCAMIAVFVQINPFNIIDRICNWYLSICPSSIILELYLSIYISIYLSIWINMYLSIHLLARIDLSVCLYVRLKYMLIDWNNSLQTIKLYIPEPPLPAYPFPFKSSIAI